MPRLTPVSLLSPYVSTAFPLHVSLLGGLSRLGHRGSPLPVASQLLRPHVRAFSLCLPLCLRSSSQVDSHLGSPVRQLPSFPRCPYWLSSSAGGLLGQCGFPLPWVAQLRDPCGLPVCRNSTFLLVGKPCLPWPLFFLGSVSWISLLRCPCQGSSVIQASHPQVRQAHDGLDACLLQEVDEILVCMNRFLTVSRKDCSGFESRGALLTPWSD